VPHPFGSGGGNTLAGEGVGVSQFRRGDRHCGTLGTGMSVLCGRGVQSKGYTPFPHVRNCLLRPLPNQHGLVATCYLLFFKFITFQLRHYRVRKELIQISQLLKPTPVSSQLMPSRGISIGVPGRESNPGLLYSRPTHYDLSYSAPYLSYAAP
jgi:hypothetical protein